MTQGEDWLFELDGFVTATTDPQVVADIENEILARYEAGERPGDVYTNRMVCNCDVEHELGRKGCGARWDIFVRPEPT